MSARIINISGIPTTKEAWLDELTNPDKAEVEKERQVREYINQLAEVNYKRMAEIEALKAHAQRLGEHAMRLQQQQAQAQKQANEAGRALAQEFRELADRWYEETMWLSSTSEIVSKESYYELVALGKEVVPFILRELQGRGGHWFLALRVLTKKNPVKPEDRGNIRKMSQAWLDWGKEQNLI